MGGRIPEEFLEQLRRQLDLVDLVGHYVTLRKSGRNWFGLCPFHSEKSPSFSVAPDKQIYYCFGCGAGGDAIRFVMEIEQLTFVEAVRHLAERVGLPLPAFSGQDGEADGQDERVEMRRALELAARLYHHVLTRTPHGEVARQYLRRRRIEPATVQEFQIGYAPDSPDFLLRFMRRRGYVEDVLEKAGLILPRSESRSRTRLDRFRGRIMVPIHDGQGRIIGFAGRLIGDGKPKYMNTPETLLFHKGNHLFNLHRARSHIRKERQAVLLEGYLDVISAWQAGIRNVVATQGTSLTEPHAKVLRRNCETVILCYDADESGQQAALRGADVLRRQDLTVKVAKIPDGLDPDDYVKRFGGTAFREEILAAAMSLTSFKLESLKKNADLQDEDGRMKYLAEAVDLIAELPQAIEQDHYLRKLADEFKISLDALKEELRKAKWRRKREAGRDKAPVRWNNGYREDGKHLLVEPNALSVSEKSEMYLVAYMLRDRNIAEWVKERVGGDFHHELFAALAAYLYAWYDRGSPADPGLFIASLPDPDLVSRASELAMLELPEEIPEEALEDYVRHVKSVPLLQAIGEMEKQVEQLSRAGDPVKAAELMMEINRLRKQLGTRTQ
ncbi:DNA primase [Staphylospora marina]|uniref:DNA primase n=1 Tax=Staphylospora marina TaxID=2490858 RepID=UPI000F5C182B|nr:DNA primase [Staphylospora marina]